jgi:hypothetical protein
MGSKSSPSTSASDAALASIYSSSSSTASTEAATSAAQLAQSKSEYDQEWPYVQNYMTAMTGEMNQSLSSASEQQSRLENVYYPVENQYVSAATSWDSPAREAQASGAAQADVANSYTAQRNSALQSLESYGVDPSQTRYGAMDLGARISQAAASSSAGTGARLSTETTGLGLLADVTNVGRGYSSSIASAANTGISAGSSGINAANTTNTTYGNLEGTATQYAGLSNSALGTASNAVNSAYSNELSGYNASSATSASTYGGIGSLVGGVAMAAII